MYHLRLPSLLLLILTLKTYAYEEEKQYLINQVITKDNNLTIVPHSKFKHQYLFDNFKAQYENFKRIDDIPTEIITIPFILSTISLIWESGEKYYVKKMDKNLMRSIEKVKEVFKVFYPHVTWSGLLIADELVDSSAEPDENSVGLVFSGGVDSTYTSLFYHSKQQLLITCLGFSEEMRSDHWNTIRNQCISFSKKYGNRENIFIKSNFRSFIKGRFMHKKYPSMNSWREFCQEALSLAGLAAPVLWQKKSPQLLISSSWDWQFPYPWGSHPFIDNNIHFAHTRVKNFSYEVTRQEKLRSIKDFCSKNSIDLPYYHVCRGGEKATNCTRCEKCLRTINGLIVEEEDLEQYGFFIDFKKACNLTKAQFSHKTNLRRFTHAVCHIWQTIASRARERLTNAEIADPNLKEYLSWLSNINFARHINLHQFKYPVDFNKHMYFLHDTA